MNWLIERESEILNSTLNLRKSVLDIITDGELEVRLGGQSQSLREILLELAAWQGSYAKSFKTFKLSFVPQPEHLSNVAEFKTHFEALDTELTENLKALTDADLEKTVDRGTWSIPVTGQFHVFRENILIFAAKASVYLRIWNKPFDQQFKDWIA